MDFTLKHVFGNFYYAFIIYCCYFLKDLSVWIMLQTLNLKNNQVYI